MHFKGWKHTQLKKSSPINPAVFLLWDNVSSCSPSWPWTIIFLTLPCWGYRFVPLTTPSFSLVNLVTESLPGNFHLTGTWWKWMVCQGQRPRFVNGWWLLHKEPIRPEQLRPGQQNLPGGPQSECSVNAVWGRTGPGWWEGYCPLSAPPFIPQSKYQFLLKTDSWVRLDRRIQMLATDGVFIHTNYPGYKARGVGFSAWAYQYVVKPCLR